MIETNFTPFPVLATDRLILRQIETFDDKDIFVHRSDDRVNSYLEGFRHASIEETQAFIARIQQQVSIGKSILWVLTHKNNNKFIGTICLWNISHEDRSAETGYTLDPEFHGKGYMQEALVKIIDFGFNFMKLRIIEAYTHKDNRGSKQLLLRNEFKMNVADKKEDCGPDLIVFTLTNE